MGKQSTMAITPVSKRVTRLRAREQSVRTASSQRILTKDPTPKKVVTRKQSVRTASSQRILTKDPTSKKVVTHKQSVRTVSSQRILTKDLKKVVTINTKDINVSAKDKSLHVPQENVSLRNTRTPLLRLRPRRNKKNYCENSKLLQQYISPEQQDSRVILEKIHLKDDKKVPVYKAVEPSEKSLEDKNDVYDFKFDLNDAREKASKKRKRNVNKEKERNVNKPTKKTTRKKVTARTKAIDREIIESAKPAGNLPMKIAQGDTSEIPGTKSTKKDSAKKIETKIDTDIRPVDESMNKDTEKEIEPPRIEVDLQTIEETEPPRIEADIHMTEEFEPPRIEAGTQMIEEWSSADEDDAEAPRANTNIHNQTTLPGTYIKQVGKENAGKPRVVSIENANNIIVTKSPSNRTGDSQPFRPKSIFDNKISLKEPNNTLRCSLMKTLSPIQKSTAETEIDFSSPWRPPTLMFSQTKHFIQSTPYKIHETKTVNKGLNKKSVETNKENVEMNRDENENMEMDKENMDTNKENKGGRDKENKKKIVGLRKKHAIQRKLSVSENQSPEKVKAAVASKPVAQPARVSLGEIKNLLQRPNVNGDNKQTVDQAHAEVDKLHLEQRKLPVSENRPPRKIKVASKPARVSLGEIKNLLQGPNGDNKQTVDQADAEVDKSHVEPRNKQLLDVLNFSDTFDVLSESEKLSNIGNDAPLFMDLEPSHFSKPAQHSYRRKRAVKFDLHSEDSDEEENENVKLPPKKKKLTKLEKEQEKRLNEWVKTVNTTFQEIEEYDLVIE
ncbi:PREDICTED: uncharacterized protein LOC105462911 isoform X2 [Wasmannia auropunctata]|uniref:uncharacterized protein LOC105462911 isoform X2 n=1 Tax=Wasmannia auropunctata TaxID=64793 RepID=UPI0005ED9989|nr:PREDICTED: uncharacterized protein LOC105462911 isoform X2 [Wasmannia auropunctata]